MNTEDQKAADYCFSCQGTGGHQVGCPAEANRIQKVKEKQLAATKNGHEPRRHIRTTAPFVYEVCSKEDEGAEEYCPTTELAEARAEIDRLRDAVTWMRDKCGYGSPVWMRMNEALSSGGEGGAG